VSNIDSCPLCGTAVHVVGSDEGTQHYEPVARPLLYDDEASGERLAAALHEAGLWPDYPNWADPALKYAKATIAALVAEPIEHPVLDREVEG
jgi:hypothetical protein